MTQYFTAQNFVYWSISFIVAYIYMKLIIRRIDICAQVNKKNNLTFTKVLIAFFVWPILLILIIFVEFVFLLYPEKLLQQIRNK